MIKRIPEFREQVASNATFKIVALVASVILWLTILGRRDAVMVKNFNLEFLVPSRYSVQYSGFEEVQIKAVGPRMALKKFSQIDESIVLDLNNKKPGGYNVRIPKEGVVDLPLGVRILSIKPNIVRVNIIPEGRR